MKMILWQLLGLALLTSCIDTGTDTNTTSGSSLTQEILAIKASGGLDKESRLQEVLQSHGANEVPKLGYSEPLEPKAALALARSNESRNFNWTEDDKRYGFSLTQAYFAIIPLDTGKYIDIEVTSVAKATGVVDPVLHLLQFQNESVSAFGFRPLSRQRSEFTLLAHSDDANELDPRITRVQHYSPNVKYVGLLVHAWAEQLQGEADLKITWTCFAIDPGHPTACTDSVFTKRIFVKGARWSSMSEFQGIKLLPLSGDTESDPLLYMLDTYSRRGVMNDDDEDMSYLYLGSFAWWQPTNLASKNAPSIWNWGGPRFMAVISAYRDGGSANLVPMYAKPR